MNDYERAIEGLQQAIDTIEAIDGVDPDIEQLIHEAAARLENALVTATERI